MWSNIKYEVTDDMYSFNYDKGYQEPLKGSLVTSYLLVMNSLSP